MTAPKKPKKSKMEEMFFYYLAAGIIFLSFLTVFLLMFIEIPESNKSIIHMAAGVIISSGFVVIVHFFYGSSTGSKDKDKRDGK